VVIATRRECSPSQVLSPVCEREFSDQSYGFRPHRSCHDALRRAQSHVNAGYKYEVDLDLEKFFDTVSHSRLIELLSELGFILKKIPPPI
jgi:retron-type reverse transcriptase